MTGNTLGVTLRIVIWEIILRDFWGYILRDRHSTPESFFLADAFGHEQPAHRVGRF
jgi:hypothetical protein